MSTKVVIANTSTVVASAPPVPTGLTADPLLRGVNFSWDAGVFITPYYYEYQLQVESDGWGAAVTTVVPNIIRMLTAVEIGAHGADTNIQIRVRSIDGLGSVSAWATTNTDCLPLVIDAVLDTLNVAVANLDPAVTGRIFTTADRSADDLTPGNTHKFASEQGADVTAQHTSYNTERVGGSTAAQIVDQATKGETAYNKIPAAVIAGTDTLSTAADVLAAIGNRLSAVEKSNLETAMGVTLALLDPLNDDVLLIGTHENLSANATAVKNALGLSAVENKSSTDIRDDIVEADMPSTVVLDSTVLSKINASTESAKIVGGAIASVKGSTVEDDTLATPLFNAAGNLITGITSGATTRTVANLVAAVSASGQAQNLNLASIGAGTLNDIPETGTDKTVTANEKLGAGYAFTGLDSSGYLKTAVIDGTVTKTANEIVTGVRNYEDLWSDEDFDVTGVAWTTRSITIGVPGQIDFYKRMMVHDGNHTQITFEANCVDKANGAGKLGVTIRNAADGADVISLSSSAVLAANGTRYAVTVDISALVEGTRYILMLSITGTNGQTYQINRLNVWRDNQ